MEYFPSAYFEAVEANLPTSSCSSDLFQCASSECIQWVYTCDGQADCFDGTDEDCQGKKLTQYKIHGTGVVWHCLTHNM